MFYARWGKSGLKKEQKKGTEKKNRKKNRNVVYYFGRTENK